MGSSWMMLMNQPLGVSSTRQNPSRPRYFTNSVSVSHLVLFMCTWCLRARRRTRQRGCPPGSGALPPEAAAAAPAGSLPQAERAANMGASGAAAGALSLIAPMPVEAIKVLQRRHVLHSFQV